MNRSILYPKIRAQFLTFLAWYIEHPLLKEGEVDNYIVRSEYGNDVGILSAHFIGINC